MKLTAEYFGNLEQIRYRLRSEIEAETEARPLKTAELYHQLKEEERTARLKQAKQSQQKMSI